MAATERVVGSAREQLFEAWRRPRGQCRAMWEKVPGIEPAGKYIVFANIQKEFWKAYEIEYEYAILPEGAMPEQRETTIGKREPMSPSYRTRRMKPG